MRKFLLSSILIIFAVAAGWYYVPQDFKDKTAAFIGVAASRDTGEIKNFIGDVILPQDPEKRREVLVKELKKNLLEIKERAMNTGKAITFPKKLNTKTTEEIISSSEKIIKELEESNSDKSLAQEAGGKILDNVFPRRPTAEQCQEICK